MTRTYIVANSVRCLLCNDSIFSAHRHDFVTCTCGNISVDGGQEYLRRVGDIRAGNHIDTSISVDYDDMVFMVDTLKDMRALTEGKDFINRIVECVVVSLMMGGYMTVDTQHDLEKQFLTYCGEDARTAVVWALDTGHTNAGIVNAVIRSVRDAGFFQHKET